MPERLLPGLALVAALAGATIANAQTQPARTSGTLLAPFERVTFDQAVARALEHNPTVAEATQAILRAQALLDQAKSVFRPTLYGHAGATMLDDARGFDGLVTQPRTQAAFA